LDRRLKALQAELDQYRSEIDGYERNIRLGVGVNRTTYQATIDAHNERVQDFNSLLSTHKTTFRDYEKQIDAVNAKVDEYNRQRGR
jgi:chromosome segregation ATPase